MADLQSWRDCSGTIRVIVVGTILYACMHVSSTYIGGQMWRAPNFGVIFFVFSINIYIHENEVQSCHLAFQENLEQMATSVQNYKRRYIWILVSQILVLMYKYLGVCWSIETHHVIYVLHYFHGRQEQWGSLNLKFKLILLSRANHKPQWTDLFYLDLVA